MVVALLGGSKCAPGQARARLYLFQTKQTDRFPQGAMNMATIHLEPGRAYAEQTMAVTGLRRPLFPAVRWGAVFAGVAVSKTEQLVLTLLGIASGLSSIDIAQGDTMGMGPLMWAGISMLSAACIGGYVAARMTGLKRKADGVLHGVVSWSVTTLLFATLATSAGGSILSGVFSNMVPAMARGVAGSVGGSGNAGRDGADAQEPDRRQRERRLAQDAAAVHPVRPARSGGAVHERRHGHRSEARSRHCRSGHDRHRFA